MSDETERLRRVVREERAMASSGSATSDLRKGADWVFKLVPMILSVSAIIGGIYVGKFRLELVEDRQVKYESSFAEYQREIKSELSRKADVESLRGIKKAISNMQLDVAVICAEVVRRRGGDPFTTCRTAKGEE